MSFLQLIACSLLFAILAMLLRELGTRGAGLVTLAGGIGLVAYALSRYREPIAALRAMAAEVGAAEGVTALFRMLSVALLARIAADICRDMGENTLAARVELCGRAEILLLCLPLVRDLLALAKEVLA